MKKILTLNNEQVHALYILLNKVKLESKKNKNRYKFLQVIEDSVFDYEEVINEINDSIPVLGSNSTSEEITARKNILKEATKKVEELKKKTKQYTFTDREVYSQVRTIYETECGKELEGRLGILYEQIDEAMVNVKEIDDEKKEKKK